MTDAELNQELLRQLLEYNPVTGIFIWLVKRKKMNPGDVAGHVNKKGYVKISINDKAYSAHRLAYLYMMGEWPPELMDHRDGNKTNNRWSNIRPATPLVNAQNVHRVSKRSKLGILGVSPPQKGRRRFKASIQHLGAAIHLGYHDTPEQAKRAYIEAKQRFHGGFVL